MDNHVNTLKEVLISRVKNLLIINFFLAWCIWNYDIILILLFDNILIDYKIKFIQFVEIGFIDGFLIPLFISFLYIYIVPLINLFVVKIYDECVKVRIDKHKNETLKNHYEKSRDLEEIKLINTIYVKDNLEQKLKEKENLLLKQENDETERKNKLKKEENNEIERKNKLKKEENDEIDRKNKLVSEQKNIELSKKIETLINETDTVEKFKYIDNGKDSSVGDLLRNNQDIYNTQKDIKRIMKEKDEINIAKALGSYKDFSN